MSIYKAIEVIANIDVESILKQAKKEKELDPKAKVRNRGDCCCPAEHPKVTDNKDHFPISNKDQARNALARAGAFSKAPPWWSGTLESLKSTIRRKIHTKYPSITISEK